MVAYAAIVVQVVAIGLTLLLVATGWPAIVASGEWGFPGFQSAAAIVATASAWPILRHRPENPIGWLLLLAATGSAIQGLAHYQAYSAGTMTGLGLVSPAVGAWVEGWEWVIIVSASIATLLLFPTGRLPSPRWRPALWVIVAGAIATSVGLAVSYAAFPQTASSSRQLSTDASGPMAAVAIVGFLLLIVASALATTATIVRFRRSTGIERQQLKWLALAGGGFLLTFPPYIVATASGGAAWWWEGLTALAFLGLPVAVGIAIVRHRLFDIDHVINRSVVYLTLTALLAAVYVGTVLALQSALSGITRTNDLAIASSTLLVAALFQPARRSIQEAVDRRFYRSRYDALRIADAFAGRLRDEVELDAVTDDIGHTVERTVRPALVGVWVRPTGGSVAER
jgi:hypothetical protein